MSNLRTLALSILICCAACTKPTENIKLVVDTDIIKTTAMINVTDAATGDPVPDEAAVTITGDAAPYIYELSGKKEIRLNTGMVTIGVDPNYLSDTYDPVRINVGISAAGYDNGSKEVVFTADEDQQIVEITMRKTGFTGPPIVLPPLPVYENVSLSFTGTCPNRNDLEIRPSVYVYFKETGATAPFRYLGYLKNGDITTKLLAQGKSYDFQIVFGGERYVVSQQIEQQNYDLRVDMAEACNSI